MNNGVQPEENIVMARAAADTSAPASVRCDVMRPSALGPTEMDIWRRMLAATPSLRRAFLTHGFALACERATGRAWVAVLYDRSGVCGFLPFQFSSRWHQMIGLAERIGGNLSDATGLVAWPGFRIDPATLLRRARVGSLFVSHLVDGQEQFGLHSEAYQAGHVTDLGGGAAAYFDGLLQRDRLLVRDTERRLRKAESTYGALRLVTMERIPFAMIERLIAEKREQYQRTQVPDAFTDGKNLRLVAAMNEAPTTECRLTLSRLEAGEHVLAQHLGPRHHDVLSHWFPVYNTEMRNLSPGRLLLWRMIECADADGITLIDYGEGDALYKRELATAATRYGSAAWSSGGAQSLLARSWQSVVWRLQARRRKMRQVAAKEA
jgi:CelD/BcsL family acetyltransferase involved in cellulose biosynthesis